MEEKGYTDEAIGQIMAGLKDEKLVDDLKFACDWIDSRMRSNPRGVKALKEELAKKGISQKVIEEAMAQREEGINERAIALELLRDLLQAENARPDNKMKSRLYSFLLRRGFDAEIAEEAVNEALGE
jgi:regulatory protein